MLEQTDSNGYVTLDCYVLDPGEGCPGRRRPCGECDCCRLRRLHNAGEKLEPYGKATFRADTSAACCQAGWPVSLMWQRYVLGEEERQGMADSLSEEVNDTSGIRRLTDNDWLQIDMAARGCVSGTSDEWPALASAIDKVRGGKLSSKSAAWLQGFCEALLFSRK